MAGGVFVGNLLFADTKTVLHQYLQHDSRLTASPIIQCGVCTRQGKSGAGQMSPSDPFTAHEGRLFI